MSFAINCKEESMLDQPKLIDQFLGVGRGFWPEARSHSNTQQSCHAKQHDATKQAVSRKAAGVLKILMEESGRAA
jgi:hypothetical protein